jgi:hypothetical protein
MKKFIALSALSTVLCVASIGAFAQSPSVTPGAAASTTARHHHKHKHHHHHAKKAAVGATR